MLAMITLKETKEKIAAEPQRWKIHLFDFVDDFRVNRDLKVVKESFTATDERIDALLAATAESLLKKELSDEKAIFLIAEIDGELAGYAKLLIDHIEPGVVAEKPIELCRLYSEQKFLGKGVGAALMRACLDEARASDRDVMWLGVWEYNPRAQAFYRKWNLRRAARAFFCLDRTRRQTLLMQRKVNL